MSEPKSQPFEPVEQLNPDRAQLEALAADPLAQAHHDRLERERWERAKTAEDHFTF